MQFLRRTLQRGVVSVAWRTIAVVLALAAASPAACAQGIVRRHAPPFWHAWKLSTGLGAEYSVKSWSRDCKLRLAIVGARTIAGKEWYWLEVDGHLPGKKQALVNKVLFSVEPGNVVFSSGVALVPGHPPMALPEDWLWSWAQGDLRAASGYVRLPLNLGPALWRSGSVGDTSSWDSVDMTYSPGYFESLRMYSAPHLEMPGADDLGPAVVTTPAGTFHCERWRFRRHGPDVWVSPGAGPFGIVKVAATWYQPPQSVFTMVLTRVLKSAADKIRGRLARTDPADLWTWIYEQRYTLVLYPVPNLGLPLPWPP
jgi:hypothetical protein